MIVIVLVFFAIMGSVSPQKQTPTDAQCRMAYMEFVSYMADKSRYCTASETCKGFKIPWTKGFHIRGCDPQNEKKYCAKKPSWAHQCFEEIRIAYGHRNMTYYGNRRDLKVKVKRPFADDDRTDFIIDDTANLCREKRKIFFYWQKKGKKIRGDPLFRKMRVVDMKNVFEDCVAPTTTTTTTEAPGPVVQEDWRWMWMFFGVGLVLVLIGGYFGWRYWQKRKKSKGKKKGEKSGKDQGKMKEDGGPHDGKDYQASDQQYDDHDQHTDERLEGGQAMEDIRLAPVEEENYLDDTREPQETTKL